MSDDEMKNLRAEAAMDRCPLCEAPPGFHDTGCIALALHPWPTPDYSAAPTEETT